jgi:hypothetical protein
LQASWRACRVMLGFSQFELFLDGSVAVSEESDKRWWVKVRTYGSRD